MELILTDEEYYDLFKALRFAIEQVPDLLPGRNDLLQRMVMFYKVSPDVCQFVITTREIKAPATVIAESEVTA